MGEENREDGIRAPRRESHLSPSVARIPETFLSLSEVIGGGVGALSMSMPELMLNAPNSMEESMLAFFAEGQKPNLVRPPDSVPKEGWLLDDLQAVSLFGPLVSRLCPASTASTQKPDSEGAALEEEIPWLEGLAQTASGSCQMPASAFSQLLQARLSLITHMLDTFLVPPLETTSIPLTVSAPSRPKTELPTMVRLGLTTFNATLRSLCINRHELEVEVTTSVCSVLHGLAPLSLCTEDDVLLDSLEKLFADLVIASHSSARDGDCNEDDRRKREVNGLTALFLTALLRGSLKSILSAALLAAKVSNTSGLMIDLGSQLRALRDASDAERHDLSPLSEAGTLLREWRYSRAECDCTSGDDAAVDYSSIASDGTFLYVHTVRGMAKIGTGYGSEEGRVYLQNEMHAGTEGWLVHVGKWLLYMPLGSPRVLHQISPETLQEVCTVQLPMLRSESCGPLFSDGQVLYAVSQSVHSEQYLVDVLEVVEGAPAAKDKEQAADKVVDKIADSELRVRQVRSVRLLGPARDGAEGEGADCDVYTCGQNRKGELGHNNGREQLEPCVVASLRGKRVVSMAAGNESSYFLTEEGRVLDCGLNASGQLGRQTRDEHSSGLDLLDELPEGKKIVQVCCFNGAEHALLLTSDGKLYACGCNSYGQLGVGTTTRKSATPLLVSLPNKVVSYVSCSYHHTVAVTTDGEAYSFGLNDHGQLGIDNTKNQNTPQLIKMPEGVRVSSASCGQHHTVLLTDNALVYSCGRNHNGQLGLGTREGCLTPQLVESLKNEFVGQIVCGYNHTCALVLLKNSSGGAGKEDATLVYTFGYNHHGQLGLGHCDSMATPKVVEELRDIRVVKVSCGAYHTAVLSEDSRVFAFGSNAHGQLGQGDTTERSRPVLIQGLSGKQIADIACGFHHLIALSTDNAMPALEKGGLKPRDIAWYTNGVTLCTHFPSVVGSHLISRSFSLDTGAHTRDEPSCLQKQGSHAVVYDRTRDIVWVHSSHAAQQSSQARVRVYANIGQRRAAFLAPGSCLSKFPSIAEALLSSPDLAVLNPSGHDVPAEIDARSCALLVLSHLDIISRRYLSRGSGEMWQAWCIDARPETFLVISDMLVFCRERLAEELARGELQAAHLCVFALRMLRVNVVNLCRFTAEQISGELVTKCVDALKCIQPNVEALLCDDTLAHTPIHFECCNVMIDGQRFLHASGGDRVRALQQLILRQVESDGLRTGENMLATMLMQSVAASSWIAMALTPLRHPEPSTRDDWIAHCESFRHLIELLVSAMLPGGKGADSLEVQLVCSVTMKLLKALISRSLPSDTLSRESVFSQCLLPICKLIFSMSCDHLEAVKAPDMADAEAKLSSSMLLTCVLPWIATTCFLFLGDTHFSPDALEMSMRAVRLISSFSSSSQGHSADKDADDEGETVVVESAHPYEDSEREVYHVTVPGAAYLLIQFDSRCALGDGDSVQVFADLSCKKPISGVMNGPFHLWPSNPWVIPGSTCSISFESGPPKRGIPSFWGFRCIVTGYPAPLRPQTWMQYTERTLTLLAARSAGTVLSVTESKEEQDVELFEHGLIFKGSTGSDIVALAKSCAPGLALLVEGDAAGMVWVQTVMGEAEPSNDKEAGLDIREKRCFAAQCTAFACLLKISGRSGDECKRDCELSRLWQAAHAASIWLVRTQQAHKTELQSEVGDDEETSIDTLEIGTRAYDHVLATLRARAHLVIASSLRPSAERGEKLEKEVLAFVLNGRLDAQVVCQRIARANELMQQRLTALDAFQSIISGVGGNVMVGRQDALRLLGDVVRPGFTLNSKMCDCSLRDALGGRFRCLVETVRGILEEQDGSGCTNEMKIGFLRILAKQSAALDHKGAGFENVVRSVWRMFQDVGQCGVGEVSSPTAAVHEIDYSGEYEVMQSGTIQVLVKGQELSLTCKYWCPVRVLEKCEGDQAVVALQALAHGLHCHVPLDSLSAAPPPAPTQPGDAVDVRLPCAGGDGGEGGSVWLQGVQESSTEDNVVCVRLVKGIARGGETVTVSPGDVRPRKGGVDGAPEKGAATVDVSRDMCAKAHVTVSSAPNLAGRLLDRNLETYWQSDGSRPHWITLAFPRKIRVQGVGLYVDFLKDRSFTPRRVSVRAGSSSNDLKPLSEVNIKPTTEGWTSILGGEGLGFEGKCLRILIHDNQDSGCNTRVRAIKVIASWASSAAEGASAARHQTEQEHLADAAQHTFRFLAACSLTSSDNTSACPSQDTTSMPSLEGTASCIPDASQAIATGSNDAPRSDMRLDGDAISARNTCLSLVLDSLRASLSRASLVRVGSKPKLAEKSRKAADVPESRDKEAGKGEVALQWVDFLLTVNSMSPYVRQILTTHDSLDCLHAALYTGTPRLQQRVLRLYRSVLPHGEGHMGSTLPQRMLLFAGQGLCVPPVDSGTSVHWSVGVQAVYLLRVLLGVDAWRTAVRGVLEQTLARAARLPSASELVEDTDLACTLGAALGVLGGLIDGLRPGATVCLTECSEDEGGRGDLGVVSHCHHDSTALTVTASTGGALHHLHVSQMTVVDEIPLSYDATLAPSLLAALRALHALSGAESFFTALNCSPDADGSNTDPKLCASAALLCQLRCMATAAVCAHAHDEQCAGAFARMGLLETLMSISSSNATGGADSDECTENSEQERVHIALLERFHHRARYGESEKVEHQGQGGDRRGASGPIDIPAPPAPESRREGEQRLREAQRQALATDLTVLGYSIGLCKVALQLNGEDPQAAAGWLLDSSAQYVESHPEVLLEGEEAPLEHMQSRELSSLSDPSTESSELQWQAYHLARSYEDSSEGSDGAPDSSPAPRGVPPSGARGDAAAGSGGGSAGGKGGLRAEEVRVGQLVCVVDGSGRGGELEIVQGRCGEVRSVDREAKAVLMEFSDPLDACPLSRCTVHLSAIGRPERTIAQTLGYSLSLRGGELWGAFGRLQASMAMKQARRATCCIIVNVKDGKCGSEAMSSSLCREVCRVMAWNLCQAGEARSFFRAKGSRASFRSKLAQALQHASLTPSLPNGNGHVSNQSEAEGTNQPSERRMSAALRDNMISSSLTELESPDDDQRGEAGAGLSALISDDIVSAVVEECVELFKTSSSAFMSAIKTEESQHPAQQQANGEVKSLKIPGREGINIQFDTRSCLPAGQKVHVYTDRLCSDEIAVFSGKGYGNLAPVTVRASEIWVRVTGGGAAGGDSVWGYRFTCSPTSVEAFDLARWIVWFLGPSTLSKAHATRILAQLCTLWSEIKLACPMRLAVGRFLARMLRALPACDADADVEGVMMRVRADIAWRVSNFGGRECREVGDGKHSSVYLQTLVELFAACATWTAAQGECLPPHVLPHADGDKNQIDDEGYEAGLKEVVSFAKGKLGDVGYAEVKLGMSSQRVDVDMVDGGVCEDTTRLVELVEHLSRSGGPTRLPDAIVCQSWLRTRVQFEVRESVEHPYKTHCVEEGTVHFAGAEKLLVFMDFRCSTDGDDYLRISRTQDASTKLGSYSGRFGVQRAKPDAGLTVDGDTLHYSFQGHHGSDWGFRFIVMPQYSADHCQDILTKEVKVIQRAAAAMEACFGTEEDAELVRLVNELHDDEGVDSLSLPPAAIVLPLDESNKGRYPRLEKLPVLIVRLRFAVLQSFNSLLLRSMLSLVDLSMRSQPGTLAHTLSQLRRLIFFDVKARFIENVLAHTRSRHIEVPLVVLDRRSTRPVFKQMHAQLCKVPPARLKGQEMAFRVQFAGEGAEGDNGPYRECFAVACEELESDKLELLVLCPNAVAGGKTQNQDAYVIRPSASSPSDLEMFELLGKLIGISMRTGLPLDLHLSPLVWRQLVGDAIEHCALECIDAHAHRTLSRMLLPDSSTEKSEDRLNQSNFAERVHCNFEVVRSDGSVAPVMEGGANVKVTWENRMEYADKALRARLSEGKRQTVVIGKGLKALIPSGVLCLLGGSELERLVTGRDDMDIELLRQHTVYRGVTSDDDLVKNLWEALRGFSGRDRALFLRFVWGRSRLPRATQFSETFKVHFMPGSGDGRLPKADTCFFTLHLPHYSSIAVLSERLLYAVRHCADMDLK